MKRLAQTHEPAELETVAPDAANNRQKQCRSVCFSHLPVKHSRLQGCQAMQQVARNTTGRVQQTQAIGARPRGVWQAYLNPLVCGHGIRGLMDEVCCMQAKDVHTQNVSCVLSVDHLCHAI